MSTPTSPSSAPAPVAVTRPTPGVEPTPASVPVPAPATPESPTGPQPQRMFSQLRVEIDVTPRWFAPGGNFDDDLLAILGAWRENGGDLRKLMVDFQAGLSGVRFILGVPSGVSTDAIEEARQKLVAAFDSLDLVSPRRRAMTEMRLESRSRRLRAVPKPVEPPKVIETMGEPVAPPPQGSEDASPVSDDEKERLVERGEAKERALDLREERAQAEPGPMGTGE